MARKPSTPKTVPPRRYVVKDDTGEFLIDLPAGSRLTFGPDVPFERGVPSSGERSYSLRVYSGRENSTLAACFARVQSFREVTIALQRVAIRQVDRAGAEYLMVASLGDGFSAPVGWTLHRRVSATALWGPPEHTCASQVEAEAALEQMIRATDRLRGAAKGKAGLSDDLP